jgi:hypothetical protein
VLAGTLDLLDDDACYIMIVSALQRSVIRQMVFPYVYWRTRLVEDHGNWQDTMVFPAAYIDALDDLECMVSGRDNMTCDLTVVLAELAAAIRVSGGGGAGCASSGPGAVLNCLPGMTPEELVPQAPAEPPEPGVPPEGFDTWEEYLDHKCKAAYAIVDAVAGLFGALALAPVVIASLQVISALLTGYIGGLALASVAFTPVAILAIAAGAVAVGLLAGTAFVYCANVQQYILEHTDELACELYVSGSAAEAQAGIASVVEDAIQSVEWAVIFGPVLGPEIAAGLGTIAGAAVTNNLVNPLFRVVEDFVYPDVDCVECFDPTCDPFVLCDFTEGIGGAVEQGDPYGDIAWCEGEPHPQTIEASQGTGNTGQYSGWEMSVQGWVVRQGAHLEYTQHTSTYLTCRVDVYVDGDWYNLAAENHSGTDHIDISLDGLVGQTLTAVRSDNVKAAGLAWSLWIESVEITCP